MKFTIEVDEMGRIYANGIRFSKKMTLEEVIEEVQIDIWSEEDYTDDYDELTFEGEVDFDDMDESFDDEDYEEESEDEESEHEEESKSYIGDMGFIGLSFME